MDTQPVYLRPDAVLEPLFNRWYVWAYLIPPLSAAMFIKNTHLPMMRSFVEAPQVHVSALSDAKNKGGPFIDHPAERAPEIAALLERTEREQADLIALAGAVGELDHLLASEAKGGSLEALYPRIPERLRGYVELVYDVRDVASPRYFERLLYKSPYYKPELQSLCLSRLNPDQRPFRLSTPRLAGPGELMLPIPFADKRLDALYAMRYRPRPFDEIRDLLALPESDTELLRSFFTEAPPKPRTPYQGDEVRIRYFGHACVLIERRGLAILFDGMVSYDVDGGPQRFSHADIPETIDYFVISHNHQDHVLFETMLELRHRIKNVIVPRSRADSLIDPSLKHLLEMVGFESVRELGEMESIPVDGGSITAVPFLGEHGDLDIRTKMGILVHLGERKVLMAVDANNIEPAMYDHIHARLGDADVLFVGMECDGAPMTWLYGPMFTRPVLYKNDHSRRFDGSDCDKAVKLMDVFHPKYVFIYAMGMEPWLGHVAALFYTPESRPITESARLVDVCTSRGVVGERLALRKELVL